MFYIQEGEADASSDDQPSAEFFAPPRGESHKKWIVATFSGFKV